MIRVFGMVLAVGMLAAPDAMAQPKKQTAIVEDLGGKVAGVAAFDFLNPGQTITLPAGAKLVLGYMDSCKRETITGPASGSGSVTIGAEASTVTGAKLQTEQLKCSTTLALGQGQAGKSGAMTFRGQPGSGRKKAAIPEPTAVIVYTAPAFPVDKPGQLIIERLDVQETVLAFDVTGKLFDFGKTGKKLDAGGFYRVELNGRSTVFQVSLDAAEGAGPLLLRLVRF